MKNLLICGATGFIGKNLTLHYSKKKIIKFLRSITIKNHSNVRE